MMLDCQTCGACCGPGGDYDTMLMFEPAEEARLSPAERRRYLVRTGGESLMTTTRRGSLVVCAALRGVPGVRVSCRIYDRRPSICRTFEPGSDACLDARADIAPRDAMLTLGAT